MYYPVKVSGALQVERQALKLLGMVLDFVII